MNLFRKIVYAVSYWLDLIGQGALVALMGIVILNICLRWLRIPATGFFELICLLGAITFTFTWARTEIVKRHLIIKTLISRLPPPIQSVLGIITTTLGMIICFVIFRQVLVLGWDFYKRGQIVSAYIPIPIFPVAFIISFAVLLLFLVLLVELYFMITKEKQ